MSRLAQFVDQAAWSDPTSFANYFISYYDWGAAIALALDLSLRTRSDHKVTLDHYMRRLWQQFGRVPAPADGVVARPYTVQDLRAVLADVSGDQAFADEFFTRFVHGRDVADYAMLLERAGFVLRKRNPGRGWIGPVQLEFTRSGARVVEQTIEDTPVYAAGLDREDELITVDGIAMTGTSRLEDIIQRRKPGDTVRITIRRRAETRDLAVTIAEDPTLQLVPVERTGRAPSAAERQFRDRWLGSQQ
jgi:predicted metalloprotease with PDZ domain